MSYCNPEVGVSTEQQILGRIQEQDGGRPVWHPCIVVDVATTDSGHANKLAGLAPHLSVCGIVGHSERVPLNAAVVPAPLVAIVDGIGTFDSVGHSANVLHPQSPPAVSREARAWLGERADYFARSAKN